jgi:hypothetical protein
VILANSKKGSAAMKQAFTRERVRANLAKTKMVKDKGPLLLHPVIYTSSYEGVAVNKMILVQEDEADSDIESEEGGKENYS